MEGTENTTNMTNNIELKISDKTRYTINGDPNKYIELNPGDVGILARFGDVTPIINELVEKYENLRLDVNTEDEDFTKQLEEYSKGFKEIESQLRNAINTLFDYDVCSVCAGGGSMLDVYEGEYRFIEIFQVLSKMYSDTISSEMEKMSKRLRKHTDKYTPKDHQTKTTSRRKKS